jgi:hypothetical protein
LKLDVGIKINLVKTFEVVANVHFKRLAVGSALLVEDSLCEELVCDFFLLNTVFRGVDVATCLLNLSLDYVGIV